MAAKKKVATKAAKVAAPRVGGYEKATLTLSSEARTAVEGVGNVSGYVSKLLERGWREWNEALEQLAAEGWDDRDVLVSVQALSTGFVSPWAPSLLPAVRRIAPAVETELAARALLTLTREIAAGNKAVASRIGWH